MQTELPNSEDEKLLEQGERNGVNGFGHDEQHLDDQPAEQKAELSEENPSGEPFLETLETEDNKRKREEEPSEKQEAGDEAPTKKQKAVVSDPVTQAPLAELTSAPSVLPPVLYYPMPDIPPVPYPTLQISDVKRMKVAELKSELQKMNLPCYGLKHDLIERLSEKIKWQQLQANAAYNAQQAAANAHVNGTSPAKATSTLQYPKEGVYKYPNQMANGPAQPPPAAPKPAQEKKGGRGGKREGAGRKRKNPPAALAPPSHHHLDPSAQSISPTNAQQVCLYYPDSSQTGEEGTVELTAENTEGVVDGTIEGVEGNIDSTVEGNIDSTVEGHLDGTVEIIDDTVEVTDGTIEGNIDSTVEGNIDNTVEGNIDSTVEGTLEDNIDSTVEGVVEGAEGIIEGVEGTEDNVEGVVEITEAEIEDPNALGDDTIIIYDDTTPSHEPEDEQPTYAETEIAETEQN